ncbi:P-II family nitrogen regulator [Lacihabitans sp. LS3-19]|uniref:P-II family nitrogen regulator n=1 Tax=Lacihabitans sp. LS3-19 TaxID=2487335 RepID=UPI0020CE866D|nr:P-II family nitrogen regulator [Lacihabitans sp. LS3-19]MCP9769809.1 P-II family nitrogen regulator [Lacihabitans sp. LS3-19]
MKRVEAIIRKSKFNAVQEALHEGGIDFLTYWEVRGQGKVVEERSYHGMLYNTSIIERILISFYCQDQNVDKAIKSIISAGHTGEIGDGKIFISDVEKAIKIRTSEEGAAALN